MRVAIFSLAYSPFVGGAEIAVKEITDRLPSHDLVVSSPNHFFCFTHRFDNSWPKKEKIGNVEVFRLGKKSSLAKIIYIFRAWRAAERLHKEKPFEAIWAIMAAYAGFAALLFKLRHPRIPFLLTLQEGDSEAHILKRVGIFYPAWTWIFKKADYIQAISNYLADFGKKYGARCPVEVVPNGVDVDKFKIQNSKFKITDQNPKVIITTSRLVYKNGVDILIRSLSELEKLQITNYKLQILGSGPDEQKLKTLAKELGVEDQVEFLGHVVPEKILEYLEKADIFVRMSRSEGLGNSFLEAMAAGLPVIGTNVGGIPDFLRDGETGLFAKVDDAADCAQKIKRLMDDQDLRKLLGENGRKLVEEKYHWNQIADKMGYIFNKLIHGS